MSEVPATLDWATVQPYVSVTVLECTADNLAMAFTKLQEFLLKPGRGRSGREIDVVAVNEEGLDAEGDLDQLAGFVRRQRDRPSWASNDSGFEDTVHRLTVTLRRRDLVAVHCDSTTHDRLQRWLDKPPRPPFTRIPPPVLEGALHLGDAKSLWLRGVHRPRTTKPDTKSTGGLRLQDTIDPFADGSYTVGAARSELPDTPDRLVLTGIVGSTPRESSTWFKAAPDFPTFVAAVVELLTLIEKELVDGSEAEAFPHFARAVTDLTDVGGAYEMRVLPPDDLPPNASEDVRDAAALLQEAVLDVTAHPNSARFFLDVGLAGAISGQLAAKPVPSDGGFELDIGFHGTPSNLGPVRQVLDALEYNKDLLSIYYRSGHTLVGGRMWQDRPRDFAFPKWSFEDFTGYEIAQEKPRFDSAQEIHDNTAEQGDRSLFAWVVNRYKDGWLICDDGPGEVADFLHVSPEGLLSVIHVKGAKSAALGRRVNLGAFEVVVSQALKNLVFLDRDLLSRRLSSTPIARPACWEDGMRTTSRSDFLDVLQIRDATHRTEVVIVQPHVSKTTYARLRGKSTATVSEDLLRLRLLEDLLNSARSTVTEVATDFIVVGSLT